MRKLTLFFVIFSLFNPFLASAHSFGKLYNLPVPFWMYEWGAAATLLFSFIVIGYLFDGKNRTVEPKKILTLNPTKLFIIRFVLGFLGVSALTLSILSGLIGVNSSYANINMNLFWIVFLLGLTYLTAIIGNVFSVINPWRILVGLFGMGEWEGIVLYPKKVGYFPASLIYFGLIWFELIGQPNPLTLSVVLLQYSFLNIVGVLIVGTAPWFKYAEFFSVFYRLVGLISPIEIRDRNIYLKQPFSQLFENKAEDISLVWFIIFMLASTAFDGFKETTTWMRFYWQYVDKYLRPLVGSWSYTIFQTLGLLAAPFIFFLLYTFCMYLAKKISGTKITLKDLILDFSFSLIPIALAYNVAHYFTLLVTEGQNLPRLVSDPFGFGTDYFKTSWMVSNYVFDTKVVWHVQVVAILVGHIVGVYVAHCIAIKVLKGRKQILLSQIPVLVLMVIYTITGLWILSQPITGGTL